MAKEMQLNAELIPITTLPAVQQWQVDAHTRPRSHKPQQAPTRLTQLTSLAEMVSYLNHANARTVVNKSRSTRCPSHLLHTPAAATSRSPSAGPFCGMFQHEFDILVHIFLWTRSRTRTRALAWLCACSKDC